MKIEVEELYNWLSNIEELNEINIFDFLKEDAKRNMMYKYFNQQEKMEELCEELYDKEKDEKYSKFIENIILLYPLTRKLIIKLNKEQIRENGKTLPALLRSDKYVEGFYSGIVKDFEKLLAGANNNSSIQKIAEEMEKYDNEVEEYKEKIVELKKKETKESLSKVKKRDELKAEVERLRVDTDLEKLNDEIEKYQNEINELRDLKQKKQAEKRNLVEELEKIDLNELQEKEREAINILKNIWQDDESKN